MNIKIRELRQGDAGKLEEFFKCLTPEIYSKWNRFGFSLEDFDPALAARKQCNMDIDQEVGFITLDDDDSIAGYSYLRFFPEKRTKKHNASLGIVVAPGYQGKGVGNQLMLFMHDWAKTNGIKKVWLATYARNKNALRLYKKLGYQIEGIFMYDERSDEGWDHVVSMALMLDPEFKQAADERKLLMKEIEGGTIL